MAPPRLRLALTRLAVLAGLVMQAPAPVRADEPAPSPPPPPAPFGLPPRIQQMVKEKQDKQEQEKQEKQRAAEKEKAAAAEKDKAAAGPKIEMPSDEEPAAAEPGKAPAAGAAAPGTPTGGADGEAAAQAAESAYLKARTDIFSSLKYRLRSIVNRTVLGGYGEIPFTKPFGGDSFFEARRLVFFFYSPISDRISFGSEVEFEMGGTPSKNSGNIGLGEVILEFAVVDFKIYDWLNLRGGVVLVPFGKFNVTHDSPTKELTDRPLLIRTIIPSTWFETGAGLFGVAHKGAFDLNYEAYVIQGLDSKIADGMGNRAARGSLSQDNNDDKAVVGRVGLGYFDRVGRVNLQGELGVSYYDGAYNRAGARSRMLGGDLTLRLGKLELLGEVVRQWNQPGFDDDWESSSRRRVPEGMFGFYLQINYRFFFEALRRALPASLKDSTFTAVALFEWVDTDVDFRNENDRRRYVIGLNYRPIPSFVWKHELARLDNAVSDPQYSYVTSVAFLF